MQAVGRLTPLGPSYVDEFAADYLALNDKRYLPSILAKIEERARGDQRARAAEPKVVEEGEYKGRKWRRFDNGMVEASTLVGPKRFASMAEMKAFID